MDKILDKIRKLLSLADSDNENEAKLAMERANELLLRHNLSLSDVNTSTNTVTEGFADEEERFFAQVEDKFVLTIISKFFFVKPIQVRRYDSINSAGQRVYKVRLQFIGEPLNIEVARFTYWYLVVSFKRLWLSYKAENSASEKHRQAYYLGLMNGIVEKLTKQRQAVQTETGLVWTGDRQIEEYLSGTALKKSKSNAKIAYNGHAEESGRQAGKDLEILKGIKAKHESTASGKMLGAKS